MRKRLVTIFLAFALAVPVCIPAHASEESSESMDYETLKEGFIWH